MTVGGDEGTVKEVFSPLASELVLHQLPKDIYT
jgi:hypothetical protein